MIEETPRSILQHAPKDKVGRVVAYRDIAK